MAVSDGPEGEDGVALIPPAVPIPPRLLVVGTVNTDETTHAFSPKVLDRAFSIEFNDVNLRSLTTDGAAPSTESVRNLLEALLNGASEAERSRARSRALGEVNLLAWLEALNSRLEPYGMHFAYRVRDESMRFIGFALESPLADGFVYDGQSVVVGAFDAAVLMKVLPKFHGPRAKLTDPLIRVLSWAADPSRPDDAKDGIRRALDASQCTVQSVLDGAKGSNDRLVLPRTAAKVTRMLYDATTVGFASFA
jgi:5-methylcytosine-specific restriction protein B